MMRKVRLARFIWYSLVAMLAGSFVWGIYTNHWDIVFWDFILGSWMVYAVYYVIAWLLGLPKVELPSDTGGGAPVEEDDWTSDPAYCHFAGNAFYGMCDDDK